MNDLISRQAALKELPFALWEKDSDETLATAIIESIPTIDPVKHGRWIKDDVGVHCSECFCGWDFLTGIPVDVYGFRHCPNCGARMDGVGKIGHWVDHIKDFWCSECGGRIQKEQAKMFSICPYCGAIMMEGEE